MPFQSEKQRRYLWANEPKIARDWADTYGSRIEKNNGGITSTKTVKGQPHLLAYITPNEVNKLKDSGGQETMTPEGIPAYPEWDPMYGADSKESFDKGQAPKGNWSPSGDGGKGSTIQIIPKEKPKQKIKIKEKELPILKNGKTHIILNEETIY